MKRSIRTQDKIDDSERSKRIRDDSALCHYIGYSFQKDEVSVGTCDSGISPEEFFHAYVSKRRPCIIKPVGKKWEKMFSLKPKDLVEVAGTETIQVEKRHSKEESFGQSRTRHRQINMTVSEFVEKIQTSEAELLYLTTQESGEGEAISPSFQTPCAQLLSKNRIDKSLSLAGNLHLESCNLWMGSSPTGTSSGLHHDFHDNFYVLLDGMKEFTLYSPDTATSMGTYGIIERIHFNGVISYMGSETKADGTPRAHPASNSCDQLEDDLVVGGGFDYESSDEEMFNDDLQDDFDDLVGSENVEDASDASDASETQKDRPNSFSRLDIGSIDSKTHPFLAGCNSMTINLKAREMLYLPAGWFHNVTSYSANKQNASNSSNVHLAINYWYDPPDLLDSFDNPYLKNSLPRTSSSTN